MKLSSLKLSKHQQDGTLAFKSRCQYLDTNAPILYYSLLAHFWLQFPIERNNHSGTQNVQKNLTKEIPVQDGDLHTKLAATRGTISSWKKKKPENWLSSAYTAGKGEKEQVGEARHGWP